MSRAKSEFDLVEFSATLHRVADALERLAPPAPTPPRFDATDAFVWHPEGRRLAPVARVNRVDMSLLKGIDRVRDVLVENTERFAHSLPANNALLWGARGMGKSSLVKAAHATVNAKLGDGPQPGRIFGHGGRLRRLLPHSDEWREAAGRSARMGDHPRIPLRPGGLAICAGPRGAAQGSAGRTGRPAMISSGRSIAGADRNG